MNVEQYWDVNREIGELHVEVIGNKCTEEYQNRISLKDSSMPKWVLGQYWNTLFSNKYVRA